MGATASTILGSQEDEAWQFSHFPQKDVKEWSTSFKEEFPSGKMTLHDLECIFRSFFPFGSPANFARRLFETINISKTETIEFQELLIAYSILAKGSNHEKLRWIFRFYDKDDDGVVSIDEMKEVAQYLVDMTSSTLDITLDTENIITEVFALVAGERAILSFEDFKALASRNAEILKMLVPFSE